MDERVNTICYVYFLPNAEFDDDVDRFGSIIFGYELYKYEYLIENDGTTIDLNIIT